MSSTLDISFLTDLEAGRRHSGPAWWVLVRALLAGRGLLSCCALTWGNGGERERENPGVSFSDQDSNPFMRAPPS